MKNTGGTENLTGGKAETETLRGLRLGTLLLLGLLLGWTASTSAAPFAYVTNSSIDTVSVIDTATNTVTASVPVGSSPWGAAVTPDGARVYVANFYSSTVSVIDTATNTVTASVPVGSYPYGVAVTPDGTRVYVGQFYSNTVSVIDTATYTVTASVPVRIYPIGVAVTPDGARVYVANANSTNSSTVSVIDTATNTVTASVPVGIQPWGAAVTPDGTRVYVANANSNTVSVIDTATNTVTASVPVRNGPWFVAVTPDGTRVYVAHHYSDTVSVIDTATNTVTASVPVGKYPIGVAVTPDGTRVYVANYSSNTVSVIDTATNTVTASVPVGTGPFFLAMGRQPSDTTAPVIAGLPTNMLLEATGPAGVVATWIAPTATDNIDGAVPVTCFPASGSTFPFGVSNVTCTAKDAAGNQASGDFTITVHDKTPPTLTVPTDQVAEATGPGGAVVSYPAPTATDNSDGAVPVTCIPASGSTFTIGVTTVTCTAINTAGNSATKSFTVHVNSVAQQLSNTSTLLTGAGLAQGTQTSLLSSLNAAQTSLASGTTTAACGQLGAFMNKVGAQSGKSIPSSLAGQLMTAAGRMKAVIGCP